MLENNIDDELKNIIVFFFKDILSDICVKRSNLFGGIKFAFSEKDTIAIMKIFEEKRNELKQKPFSYSNKKKLSLSFLGLSSNCEEHDLNSAQDLLLNMQNEFLFKNNEIYNILGESKVNAIQDMEEYDKDDYIFVEIRDAIKFFNLIREIILNYCKNRKKGIYTGLRVNELLKDIFFRIGPNDLLNINSFLKTQNEFIKYDAFFEDKTKIRKYDEELDLYYKTSLNKGFFETNKNITMILTKKNKPYEKINGIALPSTIEYRFPAIHYSLAKENDKIVCYIYGIQKLSFEKEKNKVIHERIKKELRRLGNRYVSSDFVLGLALFVDTLKLLGIETIKVPLLQILNYNFHEELSEQSRQAFINDYSEEQQKLLEKKIIDGIDNEETQDYLREKTFYNRFIDKQDIISENKTERLLHTFYVMNEKYEMLEFLTEPFVESDTLICKIKGLDKEKTL